MSYRAKFVKEIKVKDPDSGGTVHLSVYKHENGGIFAIDSSFVDQVLMDKAENGETPYLSVYDPFADMGEPEELFLEED
jgi:hypothetical protein